MAINKVVYGNQTLIDLTADTVTASDVASGVTFHNAAGEAAVGTASGSGDVVDVEVNGVSVVDENKVAQITSYKEVTLAEYIALGDEVNTDGKLYCITDLNNSDVQGYPPLIYSTDEREVGVWVDGKPLYQKTTDLGSVSANASVDITVGIGAGVVETVVNISVIGNYSTTFWQSLPFPLPSNVSSYSAYIDGYKTHTDKIGIKTGSDRDFTRLLCTIKYTKTTDVAGSGIWNGQGGIAHHYSTNEQVVGTWIDGKPLYEKTILVSSVISGNNAIQHGISNVKNVVNAKGMFFSTANNSSPIPNVNANSNWLLDISDCGTTDFKLYIGSSWVQYFSSASVILQYTKTTD